MIMHLFRSLRPRKALILAGATLVAAHAMPLHAFSLRDPKTAALTALAVHLLVLHGRKPSARFKRNYNIEDIVRIDQALSADHWKNYLKNWFFLYYNGFIGQLEDENVEEEDENGKTIKCHAQGLLGNVISGIEPYKKACESLGFLLIVHNAIKQEEAGVETVIKAVAAA